MSLPPITADSMSVVVRGTFDIAAVTPAWLHANGLIGGEEFEESRPELFVPDEVNTFSAAWLRCDLRKDLFQVSTTQEDEFERLRDVAVGVLRESRSTPVSALGINRTLHMEMPDDKSLHAIGDAITPKELWEGVLAHAGMRSAVLWAARPDLYAGRVEVRIEPSVAIPNGVFVAYNDHYDLETVTAIAATRDEWTNRLRPAAHATIQKGGVAIRVLTNEWGSSMARLTLILERIAETGEVAS